MNRSIALSLACITVLAACGQSQDEQVPAAARPFFDATFTGSDAEETVWASDGALLIHASLVRLPTSVNGTLTNEQLTNVLNAVDLPNATRTTLDDWRRQGVGPYRHGDVQLAHGYFVLLRDLERSAGPLVLMRGGPRSPIAIMREDRLIGVVMPQA